MGDTGRVEEIRHFVEQTRARETWPKHWPNDAVAWAAEAHDASATLLAALTTQAETIQELRDQLHKSLGREQQQAETIRRLEHDLIAYRGALGYSCPGDHNGFLSEGTLPVNGIAEAQQETIRRLEGEVARLTEELEDGNGAYRDVMAEACEGGITYSTDDRLHCTCVPHLRQGVVELKQRAEAAEGLLKKLMGLIDDGLLVRNTTNDGHFPSYMAEAIKLTMTLAEVQKVLSPATGEGA